MVNDENEAESGAQNEDQVDEREARRRELARKALQVDALEKAVRKAEQKRARAIEEEKARHAERMRKLAEPDPKLGRKRGELRECKAARAELKAHWIPRELRAKENDARTEVERLARVVKSRRAELDEMREVLKRAKAEPTEDQQQQMDRAESELDADVEQGEAASKRWEGLRDELNAAWASVTDLGD